MCLAGFMRLLGPAFCAAFPNAILNIHPSLLPAFPGVDAQQQAFEHGVKVSGATVHFVTPELDAGPIVIQATVAGRGRRHRRNAGARILAEEHRIYPEAIARVLEGRLADSWAAACSSTRAAAGIVGAIVHAEYRELPAAFVAVAFWPRAVPVAWRPAPEPREPQVVDLGHALAANGSHLDAARRCSRHTPVATFRQETRTSAAKFSSDEHFGTHVDAPAHFAAERTRPSIAFRPTASFARPSASRSPRRSAGTRTIG